MASTREPRALVGALAVVLVTLMAAETAQASSFEYASEKRVIKVANLLVQSARAKSGPGNGPSRTNLESPDPHIFWTLERSPLKPANWEFVNPLAPSVVTQEVLDRWDFRYAPGYADPNYGGPSNRIVKLGDPIPKWSGAYWEVLLSDENFNALLSYDLLFITNHSMTAFSPPERDLLRRLVDAGAIVFVDDCAGMRIAHSTEEGKVPETDFTNPGATLNGFLTDDNTHFGKAVFSTWGGVGPKAPDTDLDLAESANGFFTPLQFLSDGGASGRARVADRYSPLISSPNWLTMDDLNRVGDKGITSYRVGYYDRNALYPVILNSAYTASTPETPYGAPYVALGYFGEGILIASAGDVGCTLNDDVKRDPMFAISNEKNSGYWCGTDFTIPDTKASGITNTKFMINAVSLAAKYRAGYGGPRQQASLGTQVPNAFNPAAAAQLPDAACGDYWDAYAGHSSGHSYAASANNVMYAVVPVDDDGMYLVALDGVVGRDFDFDGDPDDGLAGTPAGPLADLAAFAYPDFDVLWIADLSDNDPTATAPVIGKAAYQTGGRWESEDVVFVAVNDRLHAYEALPMAGGLVSDTATQFPGWTTNPVTLPERGTGLSYCRGRLYAEAADGTTAVRVLIRDANDGSAIGTVAVPGTLGTLADAGAGPAVAIVPDTYNGAQDETLYLPVSLDTNVRAQVLAIVLQTWNERMRPVGRAVQGTGSGAPAPVIDGCYPNWRIRDFARFDVGAGGLPAVWPTLYVNGVLVPHQSTLGVDLWTIIEDVGGGDPDNPASDLGDYQQIRFGDLRGVCPGGTDHGVTADAQVLITYQHKLPNSTAFPMLAAQAGSIKWRYVLTKKFPGAQPTYEAAPTGYAHARVAVDSGCNVVVAAPIEGPPNDWSDTFHVVRDLGYPNDLLELPENPAAAVPDYGVEPEPTGGTPVVQWDGDERDAVGSFVFWQETTRPHLGYVLQFTDNGWTGGYHWDRAPSFAVGRGKGVVRTTQQIDADPDDWYSSYTSVDLSAPMSVTLGAGDGGGVEDDGTIIDPARPAPALREEWTTNDADGPVPYGIRVFDAWTGERLPYEALAIGVPTSWWVEPKSSTIRFRDTNLAGHRLLIQVCDNNGTPTVATDDTYYHEYHEIPPIVIGQFPAITGQFTNNTALDRPVYTGAAPVPAAGGGVVDALEILRATGIGSPAQDTITPLAVDWDHGLVSFWPCQSVDDITIGGAAPTAQQLPAVQFGSDPLVRSAAPPVIVGDKVLAHGWMAPQGAATPVHGIVTLQLDPRDTSEQRPELEPWPLSAGPIPPWWSTSPGAPWPTFHSRDEGTGDGYNTYWSATLVPAPTTLENPCYDLLGVSRGAAAVSTDIGVPRSAPAVTSDGKAVLTAALDTEPGGGPGQTPVYQWWNTTETVIACQNRLLVVDSGLGVVRDIPSNGVSEVLGNLAAPAMGTPGTGYEAMQATFRGISRPSALRELTYVGKRGSYYLCDSGNDQVVEIDKTGAIAVRISNRLRAPWGGGTPWVSAAFYDVPNWYMDLPAGAPTTISAPHDAYRWECSSPVSYGGPPMSWHFEFDWIADTGNNRILGLMRQIPDDALAPTSRADEHHLLFASDPNQALLDAKGTRVERGPALQYTTCWPLRSPDSDVVFDVADAVAASPIGFGGNNFAGVVAAVNNVALSTVPGDPENHLGAAGDPSGEGPYPRNLGPGASVVQVGRLYDDGGTLNTIDDQIQWAFSEIYMRGTAPNGQAALVPFRKLKRINYIDVEFRTGADVPTGDPCVFYLTIADEDGVYPVTFYPATGPWAATNAGFPGRAVLALPPSARTGFGTDAAGYGPTWWFDAQEYATAMGALARGANPDNGALGPDRTPLWSGVVMAPVYPVEYTGTSAGPGDTTLLQDMTFSWFRPIHVERQPDGRYLVTNGHERKGEVLLLDPFACVATPVAANGLYDTDYLAALAWILPDPVAYRADETANTPEIGRETYSLGQPWAASRRTDFR